MRHFARYVILAPFATALALPALAQTIPAGQSCGGLLCDFGVIGHKAPVDAATGQPVHETPAQVAAVEAADPHHLPCRDFFCHAFGQERADEAPAPAPVPVAVAPDAPAATPAHKAHRRHVAKAATADGAN